MRRFIVLPVLWVAVGCAQVRQPFEERFDASDIFQVAAQSTRGDVSYRGAETLDIDLIGTSFGIGANRDRATERAEANVWSLDVEGDTLFIDAVSERRAGVDFTLNGPGVMDFDLRLDRGDVHLHDVEGFVFARARRITTRRYVGSADIDVSGRADVELWPWVGTNSLIRARSGVRLQLPFGGDYELHVTAPFGTEFFADDLGFDDVWVEDGYFYAARFPATTRIDVVLDGGTFTLREAR